MVLDWGDGKLSDSAFEGSIVLPAVTTGEVSYDGVSAEAKCGCNLLFRVSSVGLEVDLIDGLVVASHGEQLRASIAVRKKP